MVEGWFEFNDTIVKPIFPGTLQTMFGQGGSGSAYILLYRQVKLCKQTLANPEAPKIPEYWKEAVEATNVVEEAQREHYKEQKNQFDIMVQSEFFFDFDPVSKFVKYVEDENCEQ